MDLNQIIWVPNHRSIVFQVIEDDLDTDDVYQILHWVVLIILVGW